MITPSVQLYTVRQHLADDLPGTLKKLADIGYTRVEPYDFVARVEEFERALPANGLSAPTAHAPLLSSDPHQVFEAARRLGITTVIDPYRPAELWQDAESIRATATALNQAASIGAEYGIRVGYHNHQWEIAASIGERTALEYLAEQLEERVVLEVDTYWAAVGGVEVLPLLERLGQRVVALHIKDGPISTDTRAQQAVGSGQMPVTQILTATDHLLHVVELDDYDGDIFEALRQSYQYLAATSGVEGA
ncbi:sugar phosphate isomerase/epimerase [Glutamicibacter endophyticus]